MKHEEQENFRPSRRDLVQLGTIGLAAAALSCQKQESRSGGPPQLEITTSERFEAASIPVYGGQHSSAYHYIDEHQEEHLENIRRWLRQESDSTSGRGIPEMAEMVRADFSALGFQEAELIPTSGHPGVWGFYDAGAEKTLGVYMMYDIVPVEPDAWQSPPFAAELLDREVGTILMARGATNQKGPERAFLNAVESILQTDGRLPVNLMIAAEGEEEIGSPHYPEIIDTCGNRLRESVGVICPHHSQNSEGAATLSLGMKGWFYFELEARGSAQGGPTQADIGGWYKAIVDSPVWRLVQALSTLTTPDGNTIRVPGYYDDIRALTDEEQRLINGWNGALSQYAGLGVDRWVDGIQGREAFIRFLFDTTMNINGITAGYTGPGAKTIIPHRASVKIDSTLVPNQRPEKARDLIRKHLDSHGFEDIELRTLAAYPPSQTSVSSPLVQSLLGVYNKYGIEVSVWPRFAASAPFYQFTERLELPLVLAGLGHGSNLHAPNEYMLIDARAGTGILGLADLEKAYVDMIYALA